MVQAFNTLNINPDVDQATASKAYKRLALIHHPDRNHKDSTATQRFQEIGAAWDICLRHYDNPARSHVPDPAAQSSAHNHFGAHHFTAEDDIPLDEEELEAFYRFMFAEMLFNRYSSTKGRRYRYQRSGAAGAGLSTFSGGFAESQERQSSNSARQRRENEEYERRKRELELEIEAEQREAERCAREKSAAEDRRVSALENSFQSARDGNSAAVHRSVLDFSLDVNSPRKKPKQSRKQDENTPYETLLHVAASYCDESLVSFLLEQGANPVALNKSRLTPFHASIQAGNTPVVRFLLNRRGRSSDGYHPSKVSAAGRTPLQLAIASGIPSMVELLVKDATTHDVQRCWEREEMSDEIRNILKTKKGFVPPEERSEISGDGNSSLSKRTKRKQELALKEQQQKSARIAEEQMRIAEKQRKKQERAEKHAAEEQERTERRRLQEEARRQAQVAEFHRLQEEARRKERVEQQKQAELRLKAEEQEKLRKEKEKELKAQREAQLKAEQEARRKSQEQASLDLHRQTEKGTSLKRDGGQKMTQNRGQKEDEMRSRVDANQQDHGKSSEPVGQTAETLDPTEELAALRRAKLKARRKAKQALRREGQPAPSARRELNERRDQVPIQLEDGKHEAMMRRRAEQSARDKERHGRLMEEKARTNGRSLEENVGYLDIQTCVVPDDLFRYV